MGQEGKRRSLRRRVLKGGIVAFNDRHSTLPCSVRDVSDMGARLRVTGSVSVPDTFELIIEFDGLEAPCEDFDGTATTLRSAFFRLLDSHHPSAPKS